MCVCSDGVLLVTLNPLAESMASFSRAASPYLILYLFYLIVFPFKELSLHLGGLPVWESALVSARDKGVGLIRSFSWSAEGTRADFGARG